MRNEMSLQIIMSILLVISIFSPLMSAALTTFGKSPQNQNPKSPPQPTPIGNARPCRMETDCSGIQNTTCMADENGKTRCLCGDLSAPVNGACNNKIKALHIFCNADAECIEDAECVARNNNTAGRRCYCKEGFSEEGRLFCNAFSNAASLNSTQVG